MVSTLTKAFKQHWREYLIEAWALGMFMVSVGVFVMLLEHPDSPVRQMIDSSFIRRIWMGIAMGLTAIALIYSGWGKKSGAHMNPAVTLSFLKLKKITRADAFFYILFQFVGGLVGLGIFYIWLRPYISVPEINYAVTVPGAWGIAGAFLLEGLMSFVLFGTILWASNTPRVSKLGGVFAGIWLCVFISLEAPLSGMSINPARTFASAFPAWEWRAMWIYFVAPPIGMLLATVLYERWVHPQGQDLDCHMSGQDHGCNTYQRPS